MTNIETSTQTTAERLRICVAKNRTQQTELASLLNIARSTVSQKLSGALPFRVSEIVKLADFFDVSADYLLGRSDNA